MAVLITPDHTTKVEAISTVDRGAYIVVSTWGKSCQQWITGRQASNIRSLGALAHHIDRGTAKMVLDEMPALWEQAHDAGYDIEAVLDAMYGQAEEEGAVPWTDAKQ